MNPTEVIDIETIRQSPRQFVDLETVEWLSDRVMILEQQLAAKDGLLRQADFVIKSCQMHTNQYADLLDAISKELK